LQLRKLLSDDKIIERAIAGDEAAFRQIVEFYLKRVVNTSYRFVRRMKYWKTRRGNKLFYWHWINSPKINVWRLP